MRLMKYKDSGLMIPVQTQVAGKYRVQVYRPDGRCRKDTGWFENLVLDGGLEHMGTTTGYMDYVSVGSSAAAPDVIQTGLTSFVAATNSVEQETEAAQPSAPYYSTYTKRWRFATGEATGILREVGVGPNVTNTALFSRALITDGAGTPTDITVLADEFLDVSYQVQLIPPTGDTLLAVTDSGPGGVTYNLTLRAANVASTSDSVGWEPPNGSPIYSNVFGQVRVYDGLIGAITTEPAGSSSGATPTSATYVSSSLELATSCTFGLNDGNFGTGIKSIRFTYGRGGGSWKAELDTAIVKTATDTLTFDYKTSWTRTTPL